jgi:hypothetical protein
MTDPFLPRAQVVERYWVISPEPPVGRVLITLTGTATCTVKGTGKDWLRFGLDFDVPINGLPAGKKLKLVHWAPAVWPASIANDGPAVDAGWAVDGVKVISTLSQPLDTISLTAAVAIRDVDGFLLRVGYSITLLGDIV